MPAIQCSSPGCNNTTLSPVGLCHHHESGAGRASAPAAARLAAPPPSHTLDPEYGSAAAEEAEGLAVMIDLVKGDGDIMQTAERLYDEGYRWDEEEDDGWTREDSIRATAEYIDGYESSGGATTRDHGTRDLSNKLVQAGLFLDPSQARD